jgi:hypothetical protein
LAFGLGLPLALVLIFLLLSGIPRLVVPPPQYELLYATEYYGNQYGVQIAVVDRKVRVVYQGMMQGYQQPRLWRYNPKTGAIREVPIILPAGLQPPGAPSVAAATDTPIKSLPIDVPDLADVVVESSSIAPDGYQFKAGAEDYSGDVFSDIFRGTRYRTGAVLVKNGRSIRVPNGDDRRYYGNYARLVGWIVTP